MTTDVETSPEWEHGEFPVAYEATFPHGVTAEIRYEQYSEGSNPRDMDNLTIMAGYHPNYTIGDADHELPRDGLEGTCPDCNGESAMAAHDEEPECRRCEGFEYTPLTPTEWLYAQGAVVAAPIFILDHSGVSYSHGKWIDVLSETFTANDLESSGRFVSDGAGWDTSFVGFIYVTLERALELGIPGSGWTPEGDGDIEDGAALLEAMISQAEGEFTTYDEWQRGEVFYYNVDAPDGQSESVGGYIGDDGADYAKGEAVSTAEAFIAKIEREHEQVAYWAARDVMTVA